MKYIHNFFSHKTMYSKPLSTMDLAIDYYQSVSVIRRSNIGVKVWLLFDNVI